MIGKSIAADGMIGRCNGVDEQLLGVRASCSLFDKSKLAFDKSEQDARTPVTVGDRL